jgi:hypothetical protein
MVVRGHLGSEFGGLQKRHSIFGRENDVHQDESNGLRHSIITRYINVVFTFNLAPLQGASRGGAGSWG